MDTEEESPGLPLSPKTETGCAKGGILCIVVGITLSEDLLKAIDEYTGEYKNRSEFIEGAVRAFIIQLIRRQQDAKDLEIINQRADYLNQEAGDVLTYQVDL